MQAYYASVSLMDAQLARVVFELERLGLKDDTIIIFTSDHGYHLGAHGLWQKGDLFEGSCRVPLLIHAPGITTGGWETRSLAEMIDLYPTLAELCALKKPNHLQGKSLVPILKDPRAQVRKNALTMSPSAAARVHKSLRGKKISGYTIRTAQYRYTEWGGGKHGRELYDYGSDPEELTNLAENKRLASVVEVLRKELHQRIKQAGGK
ncbi:MAG: sulfatase/phosphatase domain-containing protein [Akkermansiaceae bacterium]